MICLNTNWKWLCKLEYEYKDVYKNVFIDGHEPPNIVEDYKVFLEKIKELKPYIVEFNKNGAMKPKIYPLDSIIGSNNRQPIIEITHDEWIFSVNNGIWKVWARKSDTFLCPKSWRQKIMVSEFFLPYKQWNLASLILKKREKVVQQIGLTTTETVEVFRYGKKNNKY